MKKVQTKSKEPKSLSSDYEDHDPILCDGCDRHINEEEYITHWQVCIKAKRKNERTVNSVDKKEEQTKNTSEQQRQLLEEERLTELYGVRCNQCGNEVQGGVRGMEAHKSVCSEKVVECEYCYEQFPPYLIGEHYERCEMKRAIQMSLKQDNRPPEHSQRQQPRTAQHSGNLNGARLIETLYRSATMSEEQLRELLLSQQEANQAPQPQIRIFVSGRPQSDNNDLLEEYFKVFRKKVTFTQAQISALKRSTFSKEDGEQNCTICQDQLKKDQITITLECNHLFHEECLHDWLKKAATCPNCKKELKSQ